MDLLMAFLIGLVSTFIGSFVSGGTAMLSIASLPLLGLSPLTAIGTYRVGSVGADIGGFLRYLRSKKIVWSLVFPLSLIGLVGANIGARVVLSLDEELVSKIVGFAILFFVPFTLLRKEMGVVSRSVGSVKKGIGYVAYFFSTMWSTSVHIGGGLFVMYTHLYFFGNTLLETKGTNKIPGFLRNIQTLTLFALSGFVNWQLGAALLIGMLVGSSIGVKYVLKIGDKWLRAILLVTVVLLSVKLILGF